MVVVEDSSDVPCADANLAKYDLTDPNLNDGDGAPLSKYWSYWAIVEHETKHAMDWHTFYGNRLTEAIAWLEENRKIEIDCYEPSKSCVDVEDYYLSLNDDVFESAYRSALNDDDNPSTPVDEAEMRALAAEATIEGAIADDLPGGCEP
jgi:hypothetical protein